MSAQKTSQRSKQYFDFGTWVEQTETDSKGKQHYKEGGKATIDLPKLIKTRMIIEASSGGGKSVTGDSELLLRIDGDVCRIKIEDLIEKYPHQIEGSEISMSSIETLSINHDLKVEWKRVLAIQAHQSPKTLVRVRTRSGREVTGTEDHSFLVFKEDDWVSCQRKPALKGDVLSAAEIISRKESVA